MTEMVPTPHETTRTQRPAKGGTLYGWSCSCGDLIRPRFAAVEDADRAAERHVAGATKETDR